MSWLEQKNVLLARARSIDPAVRLYTKDNWFCTVLSWLLLTISLGTFKRERFLTQFATTVGCAQFYPKDWLASSVEDLIVHESQHTKQARYFGLGTHPWVGLPLMALVYLLMFLPVGLAYGRYWLERNAEVAYWRYLQQKGLKPAAILERARSFGETVGGWSYIHPLLTRQQVVDGFLCACHKVLNNNG